MSTSTKTPHPIEAKRQKVLECRRPHRPWFVFLMLLGIAGYLYLNLFLVANVPILLSGDQVFFWMNGQRMLHGEQPYRDFFQFTPPGADVFYFFLFKLVGPRIWALNAAVLLLGVALCWVCFVIADQFMERHLAVLSALLFLTLIYTRLLIATHHYFSVLAIMTATAVLMPEVSSWRLAIAGALLGVASFFTQTHGVAALLGFTLLLCWERYHTDNSWRSFWKKETSLLFSFAITLLILSAPFIAAIGIRQLWYFQVTYVHRVMVHPHDLVYLLGIPLYLDWRARPLSFVIGEYMRHVFVYAILITTYLRVLLKFRKNLSPASDFCHGVRLIALVGACLLMEVFLSPNYLRVYAVSMAGIVLFVWLTGTSVQFRRYGLVGLWTLVVFLGLLQPWFTQHRRYVKADLPAGKSAIDPDDFEKLSWGMDNTRSGDFLFEAPWPGMYIPLGLRNPVFLDTAATMLNPRWAEQAVRQLEAKQVHYILWAPRFDYPVDSHHPMTANIVPLRTYLHTHYHLVRVFHDGEEVWERE
jgi:hypothetical protein